jgi:hypothetical protein
VTLPAFALPFFVAMHLCQTTTDRDFCAEAIRLAHETPELAVYVDGAALVQEARR